MKLIILALSMLISVGIGVWILNPQVIKTWWNIDPKVESVALSQIDVSVSSQHSRIDNIAIADEQLWTELLNRLELYKNTYFYQIRPGYETFVVRLNQPIKHLTIVLTDQVLSNNQITQDPDRRVIEQASEVNFDENTATLELKVYINPNFLNLPDKHKRIYINDAIALMVIEIASQGLVGSKQTVLERKTEFINDNYKFLISKFGEDRWLISL